MEKKLISLAGPAVLLLLGISLGVAVERAWFPPLVPSVEAAVAAPLATTDASVKPETPVIRVVDKVSPAVVTVGAYKRRVVAEQWRNDFFFPTIRLKERTDRIPYMGSGFLADADGYVLTNFHVIDDAQSLFVTFPNGDEFPAQLVDADKFADVALLKIEAGDKKLPAPLPFGSEPSLRIGEQVVAFGNPFGNLIEDSRPTITVGYVSALHRSFQPDVRNQRVYQNMIQTDAAINPGNSGGPLVDMTGAVVGMNTFIFSTSGTSAGIGFAIPIDRLKAFYDEVKTHGGLRPLLLDFAYQTIMSPSLQGVQVQGVIPGGPAEESGLEVGDVIVEADRKPVANREGFFVLFASKQVGDTVALKVWRGGEIRDIEYHIREAARQR
ncbi:trypsin-like serine protease [bacterium]|nr:trypsin-like serine protease [bacterium]